MYIGAEIFGIRRRKVVVVEGKKPGEQEGVFIHLSCPVLSMMSHSRVLSIQPAGQVSGLIRRIALPFVFHNTRLPHRKIFAISLEEAEAESARTLMVTYSSFREKPSQRAHIPMSVGLLREEDRRTHATSASSLLEKIAESVR